MLNVSKLALTGLVANVSEVDMLGELLARGHLSRADLRRYLMSHQPLVSGDGVDLRAYEQALWSKILGHEVQVKPMPALWPKTQEALRQYNLAVIFIPKISEAKFPASFVKPVWGQYLDTSAIKRRPLPGRWVAVETLAKTDWKVPGGYGLGDADSLARALGLETRFSHSWDTVKNGFHPKVAKLLGVSKKAVRHFSAEEWNLTANRFNWLREQQGEQWPDLGSTNFWEWCENAYGFGDRVIVGNAVRGGLSAVGRCWRDIEYDDIGFRVLVVL